MKNDNLGVSITGQALDVNVNVYIRVIDKKGRIVQEVSKHNKATNNMTEGIIRFLRGEFNETFLREFAPTINNIGDNTDIARQFIPTHIGIGNIGIDTNSGKIPDETTNFSLVLEPSYSDKSLRSEILPCHNQHRVAIQKSTKGDSIVSDTYALTIQGYYQFNQHLSTPSTLTKDGGVYLDEDKDPFTFVYASDPNREVQQFIDDDSKLKCITVTELGLFSGDIDNSESRLLARMLLDPNTPLILSSEDVMIINWQIGLYSLDDMIAAKDSSDYKYQTKTTISNINWTDVSVEKPKPRNYDIRDLVRQKKIAESQANYQSDLDFNGDGRIDSTDIVMMKKLLLGTISKDDINLPITEDNVSTN